MQELLAPHGLQVNELLQRCLATGEPHDIDLELSRPGSPGSEWIELSVNPISPTVLQGVLNDITERKRMELSSRRLATHDALTGLLNRRGIAKLRTGNSNGGNDDIVAAKSITPSIAEEFKDYGVTAGGKEVSAR